MSKQCVDEEELLELRIQALKSTSRVGKSPKTLKRRTISSVKHDHVKESDKRKGHQPEQGKQLLKNKDARASESTQDEANTKSLEKVTISERLTATEVINPPATGKLLKDSDQELKLREQALKSLLQKRVVKTGELLRKNSELVQHQKVTSTSKIIEQKQSLLVQKPRMKRENQKLVKISELKNEGNVGGDNSRDCNTEIEDPCISIEMHRFPKHISIGSDDELSLCASDTDERYTKLDNTSPMEHPKLKSSSSDTSIQVEPTNPLVTICIEKISGKQNETPQDVDTLHSNKVLSNIQCNVISCSQVNVSVNEQNSVKKYESVCCSSISNDHNKSLEHSNINSCLLEDYSTKLLMEKEDADAVDMVKSNSSDDCSTEFAESKENNNNNGNVSVAEERTSSDNTGIIEEAFRKKVEHYEQVHSHKVAIENNLQQIEEKTAKDLINDEEPGPSGYVKPHSIIEHSSDSDDSVVILSPPKQPSPIVIELSDTDHFDEESKSGKQKRKRCRVTSVKDALHKKTMPHGTREDLKDLNCSVCLGPFENRSFLDQCFHSFCYVCIIQWSELSRLCPLCKSKYNALIHSVTKELEYQQYVFPKEEKEISQKDEHRREYNENLPDGRRFRYRSTIVDHERWALRRSEREKAERERAQTRQQRKMSRRLKWSATKDRRKAVYRLNMFVKEVKQRGKPKLRDIRPEFFSDNPAMKHRLVPWLLRDLNVLLGDDDENIRFVMSLILNIIPKVSMESEEFKQQVQPFLFNETNHFVAELISFASSPYDIKGYDDNVVYDVPTQAVPTRPSSCVTDVVTVPDEPADPVRDRLLHEVFIGSEDVVPLNDLHMEASPPQSGNNTEEPPEEVESDEELAIQPRRHESVLNKTVTELASTRKKEIPAGESSNDEGEDALNEVKVKKQKKRRRHGEHKLNHNEKNTSGEGSSDEENGCVRIRDKKEKKKKKHKHKKRKLSDRDEKSKSSRRKKATKNDRENTERSFIELEDDKSLPRKRKGEHDEYEEKKKLKRQHKHSSKHKKKRKHKEKRKRKKIKREKSSDTSSSEEELSTKKESGNKNRHSSVKEKRSPDMKKKSSKDKIDKIDSRAGLIKDGAAFKTREEVLEELLLIEKAITKRQQKKTKLKTHQATNSMKAAADSTVTTCDEGECVPRGGNNKGEETYGDLVKELQDIESRINMCRGSLLTKPNHVKN
ncbi:E3 ubiquitin-protein ligase Topors-like [Hydractinia symbiolongicarpus]|uniref:E3 ubiquitin-protein ligase Topors-like n=1 Tax=Hydractinia symbiolongicarpus TaxID=13093 RepID=UPI0025511270|nr:E3 ubiquitin-protein ligase Topors-like [Hydractinia symbiolongicarpus]